MSYVVYNTDSTLLYAKVARGMRITSFETERSAKIFRNKVLKSEVTLKEDCVQIAESGVFHSSIEKQVQRKNMMSGEYYSEPINTPRHCSPASEVYWSM